MCTFGNVGLHYSRSRGYCVKVNWDIKLGNKDAFSDSFCCATREHFIKKRTKKNKNIWLHLQVQTVILAGTLIVLLMTANTLMLYSMPAWSSKIVQVVVLPGILISSCTPDRETGEEIRDVYAFKRFRSNGKLTHGCPCFERSAWICTYLRGCSVCRSPRNLSAQLTPPTPARWFDLSPLEPSSSWRVQLLTKNRKQNNWFEFFLYICFWCSTEKYKSCTNNLLL